MSTTEIAAKQAAKPPSMNEMIAAGKAMVSDLPKVELKYFEIIPGLNPVGRTEADEQKDRDLYAYILDGGYPNLPAWEVILLDNGNVGIVDAHRRWFQTTRAVANLPEDELIRLGIMNKKTKRIMVPIKVFVGTWRQMKMRVASSNTQKGLKAYEFSELVRELRDDGASIDEIVKGMGCSRGAVEQALLYESAAPEVKALVASGAIAATEVIKQVRQHKGDATKVITAAVEVAKAAGKSHVTAAAFTPSTTNPRTEALRTALNAVHAALAPLVANGEVLTNADVKRLQGIVAKGLSDGALA